MLFNSYIFILAFLPLTLLGFYGLRKTDRSRASIAFLVLMSLGFYGWWNPSYLILIIGSMLTNYTFGIYLRDRHETLKARRLLLIIGVTANLGLLAYFKYFNFFVENLNVTFATDWTIQHIILPLAISFFTFQQIAYLIDSYKRETKEYDFLNYCLFVTFFPQLIAGPIVHHKEMMPQFTALKRSTCISENLSVGIVIFVIGLSKKVLIADEFAVYATPAFHMADQGIALTFFEAWIAALSYTFQLYFDFSGYADMAIGCARMFGITLPLNFNSPYKSRNIIDFWRRWHMTLSRFLRDYLYIALGGNRKGSLRRHSNLFITMLLGGLWHGAGWNFIIWGGLHGLYLMVNHSWHAITTYLPYKLIGFQWLLRSMGILLTFLAVVVAWVFFRAETFGGALEILSAMSGQNGIALPIKYLERWGSFSHWLMLHDVEFYHMQLFTSMNIIYQLIFVWILCLTLPNTQELMSRYRPALNAVSTPGKGLRLTQTTAIITGLIAVICLVNMSKVSEFLYFQF